MDRKAYLGLMERYSQICDERGFIRDTELAKSVTVCNADGSIVGFAMAYQLEYVSPKRTFVGNAPKGPIMHTAILRSPPNSVFGEQAVPLEDLKKWEG